MRFFRLPLTIAACIAAATAEDDPPELSAAAGMERDVLHGIYLEKLAAARAPLADLDEKFKAALERQVAKAAESGATDLRIAAEATLRELADSGIPDGKSGHPEIQRTEEIYLEQFQQLRATTRPAQVAAGEQHCEALLRMVDDLTARDRIDDALALKKAADTLAARLEAMKAEPGGKRFTPDSVVILKATYGNDPKVADVTRRVAGFVEAMERFSAEPRDLGVDPDVGNNKRLEISYLKDGVPRSQSRNERETVLFESFAGPQDVKEMEEFVTGTRWETDGVVFEFGPERTFRSQSIDATWRPNGMWWIQIHWGGSVRLYRMDWSWRSFTERGGEEMSFRRVP